MNLNPLQWRLNYYHEKDYYEMIIYSAMEIICAWCRCHLGWAEGSGVSHGICASCLARENAELEELKKELEK